MEHSIVGPDALLYLLVNADTLRRATTRSVFLGSLVKQAVLRETSARRSFRLVNSLRVWTVKGTWYIVTFVNQSRGIVLKSVGVGGIRTYGHENNGMSTLQFEVHATLKAYPFALAHIDIRDDLIGHD